MYSVIIAFLAGFLTCGCLCWIASTFYAFFKQQFHQQQIKNNEIIKKGLAEIELKNETFVKQGLAEIELKHYIIVKKSLFEIERKNFMFVTKHIEEIEIKAHTLVKKSLDEVEDLPEKLEVIWIKPTVLREDSLGDGPPPQ